MRSINLSCAAASLSRLSIRSARLIAQRRSRNDAATEQLHSGQIVQGLGPDFRNIKSRRGHGACRATCKEGPNPAVLALNETAINKDDVVTAHADNLVMAFSGAFSGTPTDGLTKLS